MRKIIPEQRLTICDKCGEPNKSFRCSGQLRFSRDLLDYQGSPAAGVTTRWDICDDCMLDLINLLEQGLGRGEDI